MNQSKPRQQGISTMPDIRVFLRAWVNKSVICLTDGGNQEGVLTNIVFDSDNRITYLVLDDDTCLNFDRVLAVVLAPEQPESSVLPD